jgi:glycosyltransferase involved in cell wall biosynthesis
VEAHIVAHDGPRSEARPGDVRLVDSLHLDALPRHAPCWLLAHYLPALVEGREQLSEAERRALHAADGFVVPSAFMADALARLAPAPRPTVIVAPGIEVTRHAATATTAASARHAVVVANLVPGKGVLELLRALGDRRCRLAVVGAEDHDPAYAAACRAAAPWAVFLGERAHAETTAVIAASDFLISASRMESFGFALAEARALGVPIVALDRGNARAHVDEASGGLLVATDEALAEACVQLANDEVELARRRHAARTYRPTPRTWADAARDLSLAFTG